MRKNALRDTGKYSPKGGGLKGKIKVVGGTGKNGQVDGKSQEAKIARRDSRGLGAEGFESGGSRRGLPKGIRVSARRTNRSLLIEQQRKKPTARGGKPMKGGDRQLS